LDLARQAVERRVHAVMANLVAGEEKPESEDALKLGAIQKGVGTPETALRNDGAL
jgi:hypothetical protein